MAFISSRSSLLTFAVLLTVTAFSCSMPLFSRVQGTKAAGETPKPSRLSGLLQMEQGCEHGYYQIKLQGLFESANIQVEAQSDESGHFTLVAPPGKYLMQALKGNCGSKQVIELEDNTEHMVSISVSETAASEKIGQNGGRLPASVLVLPNK